MIHMHIQAYNKRQFHVFFSERYVLAPAIGTVAAQPLLPTTSTRTTTRKANVELVEEMPIEP